MWLRTFVVRRRRRIVCGGCRAVPALCLGFYWFYLLPMFWKGLVKALLALNEVWHPRDCQRWGFGSSLGLVCCAVLLPWHREPSWPGPGLWGRRGQQDTGGDSSGSWPRGSHRDRTPVGGAALARPGIITGMVSGKGTALLSRWESHTISLADTVPPQRGLHSNNGS